MQKELLRKITDKSLSIAIIGLGYVGLPLAVEFGKKYRVVGFDINLIRIAELKRHHDRTMEVSDQEILQAVGLSYTNTIRDLEDVDIYIVTVPTPIDSYKRPDLTPLIRASETVGKVLGKRNIVIYESTVYPGCTEEDCVPVLEKFSGLKFNEDFFCGYSPERISPGDKTRRVSTIKKITSGSTPEIAEVVDELYKSIIIAGTHKAQSLKVAEAAKIVENSQRDVNIAFMNELAKLLELMGIDTNDVLDAAGTKWNFLPFKPGLVGGHCIGVDPYYLTHKAQEVGYNPEIILAGRRINDGMGAYVARQVIKHLIKKGYKISNSQILVLGITFKENCPDTRNSKVIDIINELKEFGCIVDVCDPWADKDEVKKEYEIEISDDLSNITTQSYSAIVLAVAHNEFLSLLPTLEKSDGAVLYDVKGVTDKILTDARL